MAELGFDCSDGHHEMVDFRTHGACFVMGVTAFFLPSL